MKHVKIFEQFVNEAAGLPSHARNLSRKLKAHWLPDTDKPWLPGADSKGIYFLADGPDRYRTNKGQTITIDLSVRTGEYTVIDKKDNVIYQGGDPYKVAKLIESKAAGLPSHARINEGYGAIVNTETVKVESTVDYDIDTRISDATMNQGDRGTAEAIMMDVSLKTGDINWERRAFEIQGETSDGNNLYVFQEGEYDMYGGPYEPKMKKATVTLNGKNMMPSVQKAFKRYGWDSKMLDISRTDIWGHIIK